MPYDNPKQAVAIFLSKKRREGLAAAKSFGAKHREDFKGANKPYKTRKARVSDIGDVNSRSDAAQRPGEKALHRRFRKNHPTYHLPTGNNQANKRS